MKENLNSLEEYLVELITDDLDGLSFFEEEDRLSGVINVYERIEGYKNLDHVWQTRNKWKGVYSSIKSSNSTYLLDGSKLPNTNAIFSPLNFTIPFLVMKPLFFFVVERIRLIMFERKHSRENRLASNRGNCRKK